MNLKSGEKLRGKKALASGESKEGKKGGEGSDPLAGNREGIPGFSAWSRQSPEGEISAGEAALLPAEKAPELLNASRKRSELVSFAGDSEESAKAEFTGETRILRSPEREGFAAVSPGEGREVPEKEAGRSRKLAKNAGPETFSPHKEGEGPAFQFAANPRSLPTAVENGKTLDPRENRIFGAREKKGRERFNLEVRDQRTFVETANVRNFAVSTPAHTGTEREVEFRVELPRPSFGSGDGRPLDFPPEARHLDEALAQELRENLNHNIVREAAFIMRDGGEGSIKLSLRPESLGNVKIRLEMTENKLRGHITVESADALRAFEREMPSLERAFRESGFTEASLEMSLAQGGEGNGTEDQGWRGDDFSPLFPELAASRYDAEADRAMDGPVYDWIDKAAAPGRKAVNLLV